MKENVRTTHYSNSTAISKGTGTATNTAYYYHTNNDSINDKIYGLLYNWPAVMNGASSSNSNPSGVQGICPSGWHVPSDDELTQLTNYISSQSVYACGNTSTYIGKALAGKIGWKNSSDECAVGNDLNDNNATGFSAVPAGHYHSNGPGNFGILANFWSCTETSNTIVYSPYLSYSGVELDRNSNYKWLAFSVRCLKD